MESLFLLVVLGVVGGLVYLIVRVLTAPRQRDLESVERELRELRRRLDAIAPESTAVAEPPLVAPSPSSAPPPLPPLPSIGVPRPPRRDRAAEQERLARESREERVAVESFVGGRMMLVVGVVVVLFGLAFFLKYMVERGFMTAGVRIVVEAVIGAGLIAFGDTMRRRGFDVFGQALMGCGLGTLYLCNYFACVRYRFVPLGVAFPFAAAIAAVGSVVALWRRAPFLAYLGFLGGYLAPALLSERTGDLGHLTLWLLLVDAGVLAVLLRRAWHGLDVLALASSGFYFAGWLDQNEAAGQVGLASSCLAALVAAALVLGLVPSLRRRAAPTAVSLLCVALAGVLGVVAGHRLLFPIHRFELAAGTAALALVYFTAFRSVAERAAAESLLGFSTAALATSIAVATSGVVVAPALSIAGVAIVFAGTRTRHAVLVGSGVATLVVAVGDLLLHRLGLFDVDLRPLWNERFFAFASPCVGLVAAGWLVARERTLAPAAGPVVAASGLLALPVVLAADLLCSLRPVDAAHRELRLVVPAIALSIYGFVAARGFGRLFPIARWVGFLPGMGAMLFGVALFSKGHQEPFRLVLNPTFLAGIAVVLGTAFAAAKERPLARDSMRVLALAYLLALIGAELDAWGDLVQLAPLDGLSRADARFRASVWISIAWACYAATLVGFGFWRAKATLRWTGIAVFALTLVKVFFVDLARLAAVYRVGSFLVLGTLLVGASFLYQRVRAPAPASGDSRRPPA